jgi:peptide-methionine (S)-S-oxide reductase
VIFYHNGAQRAAAEKSRQVIQRHFTRPVVTEIVKAGKFWKAEEYHQHFAQRNPVQYELYRRGCGRDARLTELWGDKAEPYVPAAQ